MKKYIPTLIIPLLLSGGAHARSFEHISTTDSIRWQKQKNVNLSQSPSGIIVNSDDANPIVTFKHWGTTFNEQDWRSLCLLSRQEQDEILHKAFSPEGELHFTKGRISMNANDYALSNFSCSEVPGDFDLRHFNIERDKLTIIPYCHAARKYYPQMTYWMSPWSPPAWMKINNHYAVQSSRFSDMDPRLDHLLYMDSDRSDNEQVNPDKNLFPRRLAVQDYMIQDPRYLQCYADMFCKFIDLYADQNIPIDMVMYQNEAYSYTPYPGCPWTAPGIVRFNMEYLAPTLKERHPEVDLFLGTFNTNRYDHVKEVLSDSRMPENIKGVAFQWEGGQILPRIRAEHPGYRYIMSESECGGGTFDWRAGEHTFHLINHYLGNGCSEYYNWNLILPDRGESAWGWTQNALIHVNSADNSFEYTPEYYTYRHYSQFMPEGTKIVGVKFTGEDRLPVLVAINPAGKYVVVAGNLSDEAAYISVKIKGKYLNMSLAPHSLNTFAEK